MDSEYLKMILALPDEFFKDWKWQAGDKYLINYGDYWDIGYIGDSSIENGKVGYYFITVGEFQAYNEEIRPVPSQEQVQKIIKETMSKSQFSNVYLLAWFNGWVRGHDPKWQQDKSYECMWLEAAVYKKYEKEWSGKDWI